MTNLSFFPTITTNPVFSALIWIGLILTAMYLARKPSHRCLSALGLLVRNSMRLMARSVQMAEKRLSARNRDVLLSTGKEQAERLVEREFERINAAVVRDLEGWPHLQRQISELTTRLDEDYHQESTLETCRQRSWDGELQSPKI